MAPVVCNDASAIQAGRQADADAPQAAIPLGILLQILLVIILGVIEGGQRQDAGGDGAPVTARRHGLLVQN